MRKNDVSLARLVPRDYSDARDRLRQAALELFWARKTLRHNVPVGIFYRSLDDTMTGEVMVSKKGEPLYVPVITIGDQVKAKKWFVLTVGMHGDEARLFQGTVLRLLEELKTAEIPENVGILFACGINPAGEAADERAGIDGEDPSKNFVRHDALFTEGPTAGELFHAYCQITTFRYKFWISSGQRQAMATIFGKLLGDCRRGVIDHLRHTPEPGILGPSQGRGELTRRLIWEFYKDCRDAVQAMFSISPVPHKKWGHLSRAAAVALAALDQSTIDIRQTFQGGHYTPRKAGDTEPPLPYWGGNEALRTRLLYESIIRGYIKDPVEIYHLDGHVMLIQDHDRIECMANAKTGSEADKFAHALVDGIPSVVATCHDLSAEEDGSGDTNTGSYLNGDILTALPKMFPQAEVFGATVEVGRRDLFYLYYTWCNFLGNWARQFEQREQYPVVSWAWRLFRKYRTPEDDQWRHDGVDRTAEISKRIMAHIGVQFRAPGQV
jgi:hypothetical protein